MSKSLIIAEKPSLAKTLVKTIHENFDYKQGYYESESYCISYGFGHLFQLYDIEDYLNLEDKRWTLDILPYIPEKFKYKLKTDKDKEKERGIKEQFEIIKSLIKRDDIDKVINCGDSDSEGCVIINLIINYAFKECLVNKPIYRLWLPEQTETEITKQLGNLKPNSEYQNYTNEGFARAYTDFLLGINLSRLITLKSNSKTAIPVGRVLIPIVKSIYDRDMEIKNFKPSTYYKIESNEETNGECIKLALNTSYEKEEFETAKEYVDILNKETAIITNIETKEVKKTASQLFSLSELQGYVSSKHKLTFAEILAIVQSLYEKGYVTYPRTNSRYLGDDEKDKAKDIITSLNEQGFNLVFKDKKSIFNSAEIESHSALTPTTKIPKNLSANETLIYEIIRNRFIANFLNEDTLIDRTTMTIKVGEEIFNLKGDVTKQEGFLKFEKPSVTPSKDVINLPKLNVGDTVNILFKPVEKQTKAPSKFTTKMLSDFLKEPFKKELKSSEDELAKTNMEGTEIGTEATRTGILENAKKYRYISEKNSVLSIEPLGITLIEILDKLQINLYKEKTVELGMNLKKVFKGELTIEDTIEFTKKELESIFGKSINIEIPVIENSTEKEVIGKCPRCGKNIFESAKAFYCQGFNVEPKCGFTIWKNNKFFELKGKKITKSMVSKFLSGKEVSIRGFKKKDGVGTYNAKVKMIDKPPYVNFEIVEFFK